jgi:MFS family permease
MLIGYLTDKYSKKVLIRIGCLLRGLAYFGIYVSIVSYSIFGIYISTLLLGMGIGFFWVPFDSLISEKTSRYYRSTAFAKKSLKRDLGSVIGVILGLLIYILFINVQDYNLILAYSPIMIYGIGNFYAFYKFSKIIDEDQTYHDNIDTKKIPHEKRKQKSIPGSYKLGLIFLLTVLFLIALNRAIASTFIMPYILINIENSAILSIWVFLSPTIVCMLLAPKLGKLGDILNKYIGISITCILGGLITFMVIYCKDLWIFVILSVLDSLIIYFNYFIIRNYLSRISVSHRGKIFGLFSSLNSIGYIIGAIVGGLLFDFISQTGPFIVSALIEWFLIPIFLIAIKITEPHIEESLI